MDSRSESVARVALVEDDLALLSALAFALEIEGYAVHAFATAEEALLHGLNDFDCIVIDQGLPGKSGLELLRSMRAGEGKTPAVMITSHPQESLLRDARILNAAMVEKPLLSDDLIRTVDTLINRSRAAKSV